MGRWKLILAAALALPMLAYVAGSLASAVDEPGDRSPIRIQEPGDSPSSTPTDVPSRKPKPPKPPRTDDGSADDGSADDGSADRPRTVTPLPDDLDDDSDDDGRGERDDDDGGDDD